MANSDLSGNKTRDIGRSSKAEPTDRVVIVKKPDKAMKRETKRIPARVYARG